MPRRSKLLESNRAERRRIDGRTVGSWAEGGKRERMPSAAGADIGGDRAQRMQISSDASCKDRADVTC